MKLELRTHITQQSSFWNIEAQAVLATRDRQRTGRPPMRLSGEPELPDMPVTPEMATMAERIREMADALSDYKFEVDALRGHLPPMQGPLTEAQARSASLPSSTEEDGPACFYGYRGPRYQVFLADVTSLENAAANGDILALSSLGNKARMRGSEIMRLSAKAMKLTQALESKDAQLAVQQSELESLRQRVAELEEDQAAGMKP